MDGFYAKLSEQIKNIREQEQLVIEVKSLARKIDLSEISREELEERCARAMASVALYQNGFRSVERGSGYFLDYRNCDNPIFLSKLVENANCSAEQKKIVAEALKKLRMKRISELPDYDQMVFQFDENGNSSVIDGITKDQIMEMLIKAASLSA